MTTVVEVIDTPTLVEIDDGKTVVDVDVGSIEVVEIPGQAVHTVGVDDKHYTHTQAVASDTWTVVHGLGKYPAVTVVDTARDVVIGDVEYLDTNTVELRFTAPFSGWAYLN